MWNPFAKKKPAAPPFPTDSDEVGAVFAAYMRNQAPMDFFFEFYIMDVIRALPESTQRAIDQFAVDEIEESDWRAMVRRELNLSDTFDIAAQDLWFRNSDTLKAQGEEYHPWEYAQELADAYFDDDSEVDVWPEGALEDAKARIALRTP